MRILSTKLSKGEVAELKELWNTYPKCSERAFMMVMGKRFHVAPRTIGRAIIPGVRAKIKKSTDKYEAKHIDEIRARNRKYARERYQRSKKLKH